MTTIDDFAARLHIDAGLEAQYVSEPSAVLAEEVSENERVEFETALTAVAKLINQVLVDQPFAESFREAVLIDPAAALANYGVPHRYAGPVLQLFGAPSATMEQLGSVNEFVPLIPLMIGGLRVAQVAVRVAPHVDRGVRAVAPYVGIGGVIKGLFG